MQYGSDIVCVHTSPQLEGQAWDQLAQADLACPPRLTVREPERSAKLVELSNFNLIKLLKII